MVPRTLSPRLTVVLVTCLGACSYDWSIIPEDGSDAAHPLIPDSRDGWDAALPDSSLACGALRCDVNAACVEDGGLVECSCLPGYDGDGQTCVDVDECGQANGGCPTHTVCSNTQGGRTCSCGPGFADVSGDGSVCADKCSLAGCDPRAICSIVGTEAICTCPAPYLGSGKACMIDQSCSLLSCDPNATCEVTGTTRACKCRNGFTGSGTQCTNVDECATTPNLCGANSTCSDTDGAYTCGCIRGYRDTGSGCENIDDCASTPCRNAGTCVDRVNGFTCSCASGFEGPNCENNIDDCPGNSCAPGSCVDRVNGYDCECGSGLFKLGQTCRRFRDNGDGTVSDARLGIAWQQRVSELTYTWDAASSYCATLALAGSGWRLPTDRELDQLVDKSNGAPTIDRVAFPGTPAESFWTSAPIEIRADWFGFFNFGSGNGGGSLRTNTFRVRCVR